MTCAACNSIQRARRADHPLFIAELRESLVCLHDHQHWEGWSVLLLKDHTEHLADLPTPRQARLFEDVALVAAAVRREFAPRRLNYACLGNVMPHVHWHVIPRYAPPRDAEPAAPVWTRPREELESGVEPERARDLVARLRRALA